MERDEEMDRVKTLRVEEIASILALQYERHMNAARMHSGFRDEPAYSGKGRDPKSDMHRSLHRSDAVVLSAELLGEDVEVLFKEKIGMDYEGTGK